MPALLLWNPLSDKERDAIALRFFDGKSFQGHAPGASEKLLPICAGAYYARLRSVATQTENPGNSMRSHFPGSKVTLLSRRSRPLGAVMAADILNRPRPAQMSVFVVQAFRPPPS